MPPEPVTPATVEDSWVSSSASALDAGQIAAIQAAAEPAVTPPVAEGTVQPETPATTVVPGETPVATTVDATTGTVVPKKRSPQERIDAAIREQRTAERDRDVERGRSQELERQLTELRKGGTTAAPGTTATGTPAVAATTTPAAAAAAKPAPTWAEFEKSGKTWEEYQDARDHWLIEETQRVARAESTAAAEARFKEAREADQTQRKDAEEKAAQAERGRALGARLDAMRVKRPDFDTIIEANLADLQSPVVDHMVFTNDKSAEILLYLAEHRQHAEILTDLFASPDLKRGLVDALATSPVPTKLLSHFATRPDEFRRLARINPVLAAKEIGALEHGFAAAPATSAATVPSVTSARPALRVVSGGPTPTPAATAVADTDDFGPDYVARMNRQDRERRRSRVG